MKLRILALLFTASSLWAWDRDGSFIAGALGPDSGIVMTSTAIHAAGDGGMYFVYAYGSQYVIDTGQVLVQRIDRTGILAWKTPVPVCWSTGQQRDPSSAVTESGDLLVAFGDDRAEPFVWQVYAARIDPGPTYPWGTTGVKVSSRYPALWQSYPWLCLDETGEGALVAWEVGEFREIWAARILSEGSVAWEAPVCTTRAGPLLDIVRSGRGMIAIWQGDSGFMGQRVVDGAMQWGPRGKLVTPCPSGMSPALRGEGTSRSEDGNAHWACADGSGGAVVLGSHTAQRIDSLGTLQWSPSPVFGKGDIPMRISPSGEGGVLCSYSGQSDLSDTMRFYVAKIASDGSLPWGGSLEVWKGFNEDTTTRVYGSDIVSDGQGGAVVAFVTTT